MRLIFYITFDSSRQSQSTARVGSENSTHYLPVGNLEEHEHMRKVSAPWFGARIFMFSSLLVAVLVFMFNFIAQGVSVMHPRQTFDARKDLSHGVQRFGILQPYSGCMHKWLVSRETPIQPNPCANWHKVADSIIVVALSRIVCEYGQPRFLCYS